MKIPGTLLALFVASLLSIQTPSVAYAEDLKVEVNASDSVKQLLTQLTGKTVSLHVRGSAESVSGTVESVGSVAVKIGQLTGKEFYSALVNLDQVSAVVYRSK